MQKNRLKIYIIIAVCAVCLLQMTGYAKDPTSNADVEFVEGNGPTRPVDPDFPDVDTEEPAVSGSLAIVSASPFDFGSIPITTTTSQFGITIERPNIQVVDLRGTFAGWTLSAKVTPFNDGEADTLPGAAIHITTGRPISATSTGEPEPYSNVVLTTDGEEWPVIIARPGTGAAHWVMRWYPPAEEAGEGSGEEESGGEGGGEEESEKYIKLEVPAGSASIGNHRATITWILGDTP